MGAGGSTGGKKGELLETMADHEESINCMCLSVSPTVSSKARLTRLCRRTGRCW